MCLQLKKPSAVTVAVDWEGNGDFTSDVDDISADVLRWQYWRGRNFESIAGRATAGTASIAVLNDTGKYSRSNSKSPLSGLLFGGAAVEIRELTSSGTLQTRFSGYLRDVKPNTSMHYATLSIDGAFSRVVSKRIKPPVSVAGAPTGVLINSALDVAGWPAGKRNVQTGQTTTGPYGPDETLAFDALADLEQTEGGLNFEDSQGNFVFQDRSFRLTGGSLIPQAVFSDLPTADFAYLQSTQPEEPIRDVYNDVTVAVNRPTRATTSVIWTFDDAFPHILAGETLILIASYTGDGIIDWLTPVIGTDLTATVPNADLAVTVAKSAKEMQISIINNAATAATLTKLQARGSLITFTEYKYTANELNVPAALTSKNRYGSKTYPLEVPYLSELLPAQDRAHAIITQYAEPNPIIPINFEVYNDALKDKLLSLEISSRITFVAEGVVTNFGINTDFYVESISESRDYAKGLHSVTLEVSSAAAYSGFFIWGISRWGIDTKVGFLMVRDLKDIQHVALERWIEILLTKDGQMPEVPRRILY